MGDIDTETEEFPSNAHYFKPSYVLVAIDTHSSMFNSEGLPSCFKNCLKALYRLSDHLLLKSNKGGWSPFSIVLCEKDDKASFVNFKDNMIQTTKLLKEKSALSEAQLKQNYMRDYDVDLAAFFQLCKKKFKDVSANFYKRIMIFITNNPDPVNGDSNKRFTALNEAKNFDENDIIFQLVVPDETFQYDIFYNELFPLLKHPYLEIICEDEEGLYVKLSNTIWFRHSQRKLSFFPFPDDTTKYLKVYLKSYLNHNRLYSNCHVTSDGTRLKKIYENPDKGVASQGVYEIKNRFTNKTIPDIEFDVGKKQEYMNKLNEFPTGLTLLYVSDRLTELGEVIGEPQILEADTKEELAFFDDFWQFCVNENKVLVCAKNFKKGDKVRAVELIPRMYHNTKVFLVQQIPFADEIFLPSTVKNECETFSEHEINVTDELIDRLKVSFSSELLVNEEYLRKENYVKSKLLDEPRSEIINPYVVKHEDIDKKLGRLIGEYLECFPPPRAAKRKAQS